jgi:hypothetical protein
MTIRDVQTQCKIRTSCDTKMYYPSLSSVLDFADYIRHAVINAGLDITWHNSYVKLHRPVWHYTSCKIDILSINAGLKAYVIIMKREAS